jgi:hypothetical protein
MPKDLTVILDNRPGELARLGEATGGAGINLDGICGFPTDAEHAVLHVLVQDGAAARKALEGAGIEVRDEREVLVLRKVVDVVDRPGVAGVVARAMADAGVNLDLIYTTLSGDVVIGADDIEKAREAQKAAGVPAAIAL